MYIGINDIFRIKDIRIIFLGDENDKFLFFKIIIWERKF